MLSSLLLIGLLTHCTAEGLPTSYKAVALPENVGELAAERLKERRFAVVEDGDRITVLRQQNAEAVVVTGAIRAEMQRVNDDIWAVTLEMPHVDRALFSFQFVSRSRTGAVMPGQQVLFRGTNATKPSPMVEKFKGKLIQKEFATEIGTRKATVYIPPNPKNEKLSVIYMVDGQTAEMFAKALEHHILSGKIRPTALVGLHANFTDRTAEYVPWVRRGTFDSHFDYYLNTFIPWADEEFGLSKDPHDRAIFGFSNGAEFASIMALTHPEQFYYAMPFSLSRATPPEEFWKDKEFPAELPRPVFYLAAGTLEPGFRGSTATFTEFLKEQGYRARMQLYPSGHDFAMWHLAFNQFVPRMFPARSASIPRTPADQDDEA